MSNHLQDIWKDTALRVMRTAEFDAGFVDLNLVGAERRAKKFHWSPKV